MKILIADDEPISRRVLQSALTRMGHEVIAVATGRDAIASILAPDGPRLAIVDWMMPEMDGLEVCRAIRRRTAPYVYLILLTARAEREDMLAGLDAGADDFLTKPFDALELQIRLRSGERVLDLQENLLRAQDALRIQATHDHLTGLWNRGMIVDQLGREISRAERAGAPLSVAIADIDHFKSVNDTYGHGAGDAVLQQAAFRLKTALRDCDFVGRYGGEEFLFVLPGCDAATSSLVAERVRACFEAEPMLIAEGTRIPITLSVGLARTQPSCAKSGDLICAADEALYRAKEGGRNQVQSSWAIRPRARERTAA